MGGGLGTPLVSFTISAAAKAAVRRSAATMARIAVAFGFIDVLRVLLLLPVRKALSDAEKDEESRPFREGLRFQSLPWLALGRVRNLVSPVVSRLKT